MSESQLKSLLSLYSEDIHFVIAAKKNPTRDTFKISGQRILLKFCTIL